LTILMANFIISYLYSDNAEPEMKDINKYGIAADARSEIMSVP